MLAEVEASLRRLQTDFIDLYQAHVFDDATPFEETLSTLHSLVTSGKVRFIGASNYTGWQLQKSIELSRPHSWESFVSLQPLYNLLDRGAELELLPVCRNEGVGVIAWSPLAAGWLSGKYTRDLDGPPADSRADDEEWASRNSDRTWGVIETVQAVAAEIDRTPAQVALRWILQQPGITSPNHRCPYTGAADGQSQGGRLGPGRGPDPSADRGRGRAAAVPLRAATAAPVRSASGVIPDRRPADMARPSPEQGTADQAHHWPIRATCKSHTYPGFRRSEQKWRQLSSG